MAKRFVFALKDGPTWKRLEEAGVDLSASTPIDNWEELCKVHISADDEKVITEMGSPAIYTESVVPMREIEKSSKKKGHK